MSGFLNQLNHIIEEIIRRSLVKDVVPALANGASIPQPSGTSFDIKSIFEKGIVWCPTPKKRTTAEKKLTKKFFRFANSPMTKYATSKTNIVSCLECGSYHEKGTLCGTCYGKVKEETAKLHEQMFKSEQFRNGYVAREVTFAYEDDAKENKSSNEQNRILIEVPKKRPSWFSDNLITKVTSKITSTPKSDKQE